MKQRTVLYVYADRENHVFINSGITFLEFVNGLSKPLDNMTLISPKNDVISLVSDYERGFEVFKGNEQIQALLSENIYALGDFCFVDFHDADGMEHLSEEQVAELLYLGHLFRPLKTPFFSALQNRFAYLAHDDGFFCKLYCRDEQNFAHVLADKILSYLNSVKKCNLHHFDLSVQQSLMDIAENGMLIDLSEWKTEKNAAEGNLYVVGQYTDMDAVINGCEKLKETAKICKTVHLTNESSYINW